MRLAIGLIFIKVADFIYCFEDGFKLDRPYLYSIDIWNIGIIKIVFKDRINLK